MTTATRYLLCDLDQLGIRLLLGDGDALLVHPKGQPAELLGRIRASKVELVDYLKAGRASGVGRFDLERVDWLAAREWFAERAAIREYDGLELRGEAEAGAIREVVGEILRGTFPRQKLDRISTV